MRIRPHFISFCIALIFKKSNILPIWGEIYSFIRKPFEDSLDKLYDCGYSCIDLTRSLTNDGGSHISLKSQAWSTVVIPVNKGGVADPLQEPDMWSWKRPLISVQQDWTGCGLLTVVYSMFFILFFSEKNSFIISSHCALTVFRCILIWFSSLCLLMHGCSEKNTLLFSFTCTHNTSDSRCVGCFPHTKQFSVTPAECSTVQFNYDTN